jgi:hypothetical protein
MLLKFKSAVRIANSWIEPILSSSNLLATFVYALSALSDFLSNIDLADEILSDHTSD